MRTPRRQAGRAPPAEDLTLPCPSPATVRCWTRRCGWQPSLRVHVACWSAAGSARTPGCSPPPQSLPGTQQPSGRVLGCGKEAAPLGGPGSITSYICSQRSLHALPVVSNILQQVSLLDSWCSERQPTWVSFGAAAYPRSHARYPVCTGLTSPLRGRGLHVEGSSGLSMGWPAQWSAGPTGQVGNPLRSSPSPEFSGKCGGPSVALLSGHRRPGWAGKQRDRAAPSPTSCSLPMSIQLVRRLLQQHLGCGPGGRQRASRPARSRAGGLAAPSETGAPATPWAWTAGPGLFGRAEVRPFLAAGWSSCLAWPPAGLQAASLAQAWLGAGLSTAGWTQTLAFQIYAPRPSPPPPGSPPSAPPDSHGSAIPVHKWGL